MVDQIHHPLHPHINRSVEHGVNDKIFALDILDTQAVSLQNIDASVPGQRQIRTGTSLVATGMTCGPVKAISMFSPRASIAENMLLAIAPGSTDGTGDHQLWKWEGDTSQWIHVDALTGWLDSSLDGKRPIMKPGFCTQAAGNGKHVMLLAPTVIDIPIYYFNGQTLATVHWGVQGIGARPTAMDIFQNRVFANGVEDRSNRVYFSLVGAFTTTGMTTGSAGAGGDIQSFTFGGTKSKNIRGLRGWRNNEMVVFMEDRIEELLITDIDLREPVLSGTGHASLPSWDAPFDDWSRRVIDPEIGLASERAVATQGEDIFFIDQNANVRSLARTIQDNNMGSSSLPISDNIQGSIDRVNPASLDKTLVTAYDRFFFVALPLDTATEPSHVFRYDSTRQAWDGPWTGWNPVDFTKGRMTKDGQNSSSQLKESLYFATTRTEWGEVRRAFVGTDDAGSNIDFEEVTKRISMGTLQIKKQPKRFEFYAVSTDDVDLDVYANPDGLGWIQIGTVNLLGDVPILPIELPATLGGTGVVKYVISLEDIDPLVDIQFKFVASTDKSIKVLGWSLFVHPENYDWSTNE